MQAQAEDTASNASEGSAQGRRRPGEARPAGKRPNVSLDLANTSSDVPTGIQSARGPAKRPATARPAGPIDAERKTKLEEEKKRREDSKK